MTFWCLESDLNITKELSHIFRLLKSLKGKAREDEAATSELTSEGFQCLLPYRNSCTFSDPYKAWLTLLGAAALLTGIRADLLPGT